MMSWIDSLDKLRSAGKDKWTACCPAHSDKTPSMSIKQNSDQSYLVFCFGCGANGVDVFKAMGLDLDELMGYPDKTDYKRPVITRKQELDLREDKLVVAIYDSVVKNGGVISLKDHSRHKLAVNRIKGIEQMRAGNV